MRARAQRWIISKVVGISSEDVRRESETRCCFSTCAFDQVAQQHYVYASLQSFWREVAKKDISFKQHTACCASQPADIWKRGLQLVTSLRQRQLGRSTRIAKPGQLVPVRDGSRSKTAQISPSTTAVEVKKRDSLSAACKDAPWMRRSRGLELSTVANALSRFD